MVKLQKKR